MWWRDAVVYQVYPRSFQDADGDGIGDLRGIERRLDHVASLGASAIWLSPVYPSPWADGGYDVADYEGIDPLYGSLGDFDALLTAAHERGLKLLMDLVPCHTSIEHPWFREHPNWYIRAPDSPEPPNNWIASFGGPAWDRDPIHGGWYLHSFYPEQPDLDWRNPELVAAMQDVLRFWIDRGVDGFRIDAIDRLVKDAHLRDDPPARTPFALPLYDEYARLEHLYSVNAPDIGEALAKIREAVGPDSLLVGEVYVPTAQLSPYLEHLDLAFCFEFLHAPFDVPGMRAALDAALEIDGIAWVLSNHDFVRVATRFGSERAGLAAMLLLTLPGTAFVYQGDEIGMVDGPGGDPPVDRAGRDGARHPMQWAPDPLTAGFTDGGRPWLAPVDPERANVAAQDADPRSPLHLYRRLIALRPSYGDGLRFLDAAPDVLAYERGNGHVVALNFSSEPRPAPAAGAVLAATVAPSSGVSAPAELAPYGGFVAAR